MSMESFGRINCCIFDLVGGSLVHPKSTSEPVILKVEIGGRFWNIFVRILISVEDRVILISVTVCHTTVTHRLALTFCASALWSFFFLLY